MTDAPATVPRAVSRGDAAAGWAAGAGWASTRVATATPAAAGRTATSARARGRMGRIPVMDATCDEVWRWYAETCARVPAGGTLGGCGGVARWPGSASFV